MQSSLPNQPRFRCLCIAAAACVSCLAYWLLFGPGSASLKLMSQSRPARMFNDCLTDLLLDFDAVVAGGSNESGLKLPIYATLPKGQAKPISWQCRRAMNLQSAQQAGPPAGFVKQELLTEAERDKMYSIAWELHSNFSRLGLELFLAGGSLLGSVRHLGFIPWDADLDLMILASHKPAVRQLLIDMSSSDEYRFADTEKSNDHWQLGVFCRPVRTKPPSQIYKNGRLYPEKECKTIVDFFFGRVEQNQYKRSEQPYSFPKDFVYPLSLRPFGPHQLPVPNQPERFLAAVYGNNYESECLFKYFQYKKFTCASLNNVYPFAQHLELVHRGTIVRVDLLVQNLTSLAMFIKKQ
ncbi:hypothetical protein BOX15_Mlig013534g1 [Macrostomum lignano]|uniref:LicD/FKTN/FKRP nucleotidyltransferase domain-containing protein n=1 Tax=Macrostomum lignano TaxID=282301 RepID=A0A267ESZ0_9PLAT|nr:hypothetical protein BOX15_Mlig013534g1 [Macrostomum lignano]